MAVKKASVQVIYNKLEDDVKADALSASAVSTLSKIVRIDTTILAAASEADYLPPGITQIDFLLVRAVDNTVLLRTKSTSAQYKIVPGMPFVLGENTSDVVAVRLTGNGSSDAQVQIIVGQE